MSSTSLRIELPAPHAGQLPILQDKTRFQILCCGRQFGKTTLGLTSLLLSAQKGEKTAWFAPNYSQLEEVWTEAERLLKPMILTCQRQVHRMELVNGGHIRFWSLDDPDTVRGVFYHRIVVDEASIVRNLSYAWSAVIGPTLFRHEGRAMVLGTPKGLDFFSELYKRGTGGDPDYKSYRLPTYANPYIPRKVIEQYRNDMASRVYRQEVEAEFVADAGGVFYGVDDCVDSKRTKNEEPVAGRRYFMGVDLAQTIDFTVITVVDDTGKQVFFKRYNRVEWERNEDFIAKVAQRYRPRVMMDKTGVGSPVVERVSKTLRECGVRTEGVILTQSNKYEMCMDLNLMLERGAVSLMNIPTQTLELLSYEYQATAQTMKRVSAPKGMHDDCVIALLLACRGLRSKRQARVLSV